MAKTRANLALRALEKLLIVGSGQSPDSEDIDKVDGVIDAVFADLESRHVFTVQDDEDIDVAAFEWLADCLAVMVAPDFGQEPNDGKRQRAEAMLTVQTATRPSKEVATGEYF